MRSLCGLLFLVAAASAFSQFVDFDHDRDPVVTLNGPWRFHTGDDPRWAGPAFDDSSWSLLSADTGWTKQDYAGYGGVAWYRITIAVPQHSAPLALYIPKIDVSCQIFINGRLIGQKGDLPPNARWILHDRIIFSIPEELANSSQLHLAIRVWFPAHQLDRYEGGLVQPPRFGRRNALKAIRRLDTLKAYWGRSQQLVEFSFYLLGAVAGLGMYFLRRKELECLSLGLMLLCLAGSTGIILYSEFRPVPFAAYSCINWVFMALAWAFMVDFEFSVLRQPRSQLYWLAIACTTLASVGGLYQDFMPNRGLLGVPLPLMLGDVCVLVVMLRATKARIPDAGLILIVFIPRLIVNVVHVVCELPGLGEKKWSIATIDWMWGKGPQWPSPLLVPLLLFDFGYLVFLTILFRRFARSRQDEERLTSEVEAARTVQAVLVPTEVPSIPGFNVEAVYNPAGQVGGDFYQISPLKGGGALIAIGDVSGKGMPAAMTVSLLVGTFRTLAHYTHSPSEILAAMNQRMLARSQDGFTTCLVLRLDPDGTLTAANAGHIAPYLGGRELSLVNGLPLGLVAGAEYGEITTRLAGADRLTLLTDGVVEARNGHGELLGFDRTRELSTHSAEEVARAAQTFGQQDDITVLTLSLAPQSLLAA